MKPIKIVDKSNIFNTDLIEALELHNLMEVAGSVGVSAEQRTESRGAQQERIILKEMMKIGCAILFMIQFLKKLLKERLILLLKK